MKIKAIIFDFDGVIQDTFHFHHKKIKQFTNIKLSENQFRDIHNGNFFNDKNKQLLGGVDWVGYRDFIYEDQSRLNIEEKTKDVLRILSQNYDLFIVTSSGTTTIFDYLKNNGTEGIFRDILGMESHRQKVEKFKYLFKKYSLDASECIFVTDTLGDILEANEVKIKTIAVDFGYHKTQTLEKGKPFKIISLFETLLEIL